MLKAGTGRALCWAMRMTAPLAASLVSAASFFVAAAYGTNLACPANGRRTTESASQIDGRVFAFSKSGVVELKSATAYCLSCHDGAVAPAIGVNVQSAHRAAAGTAENHPVDVAYPDFRPGFRARADLDPRLILDNGRVACKTCHAGTGTDDGSLAITAAGSQLCLACHLK